jgi:beta-phosphoglucomutase
LAGRELRLVVFDFDGVITDSEPAHFEAFRRVLKSIGVNLSWQQYCDTYLAYTDREAIRLALRQRGNEPSQSEIDDLAAKKQREFAKSLESQLKILPGAPELLADLDKHRIPCGICSGAIRNEIDFVLRQTNLSKFFRFIVAADDVRRSKPDPEAYLLSMKIGREFCNHAKELEPLECIAVEDSVGGVQAAKAAGMICVGVTNSYPADQIRQADVVVDDLTVVDADFLRQLVN